jgi:hypothetical protein
MRTALLMAMSAMTATMVVGCGSGGETATETLETAAESSAAPSSAPSGSNIPPGLVERATWTDGPWPFTVDYATLMCQSGIYGNRVTVTADREMYAFNGTAKSADLWPDFDVIWADDPAIPGLKVNIDPMLQRGLALC